jgi:hypothetical protein
MRPEDSLELVAIAYSQDELGLLTSRLRWEGIHVFLHSQAQIAVDVSLTIALGGVRLLVPNDQAEQTRQILRAMPAWERGAGVYCDNRLVDLLLAFLLVMMTGIPPPARIRSVLIAAVGGDPA